MPNFEGGPVLEQEAAHDAHYADTYASEILGHNPEVADEEPDFIKTHGDQLVSMFGMQMTLSEAEKLCEVDLSKYTQAERNRYGVNFAVQNGAAISKEFAHHVKPELQDKIIIRPDEPKPTSDSYDKIKAKDETEKAKQATETVAERPIEPARPAEVPNHQAKAEQAASEPPAPVLPKSVVHELVVAAGVIQTENQPAGDTEDKAQPRQEQPSALQTIEDVLLAPAALAAEQTVTTETSVAPAPETTLIALQDETSEAASPLLDIETTVDGLSAAEQAFIEESGEQVAAELVIAEELPSAELPELSELLDNLPTAEIDNPERAEASPETTYAAFIEALDALGDFDTDAETAPLEPVTANGELVGQPSETEAEPTLRQVMTEGLLAADEATRAEVMPLVTELTAIVKVFGDMAEKAAAMPEGGEEQMPYIEAVRERVISVCMEICDKLGTPVSYEAAAELVNRMLQPEFADALNAPSTTLGTHERKTDAQLGAILDDNDTYHLPSVLGSLTLSRLRGFDKVPQAA